jgi:hypothetical protein
MIQDKAPSAVNGRVHFKGCNAVLNHLACSESVNTIVLGH